MKSAITLLLVLSAIALPAVTEAQPVPPPVVHYFPGSSCKHSSPGDAANVTYSGGGFGLTAGIGNTGASPMSVICPLPKSVEDPYSAEVGIMITHYGSRTTSCTALATDNYGVLQEVETRSVNGDGAKYIALSLGGVSYGTYYVRCTIPANSKGLIHTLRLYEFPW